MTTSDNRLSDANTEPRMPDRISDIGLAQAAADTRLPKAFLDGMAALLRDETPAFLRTYAQPFTRAARVRTGYPKPADALDPVPWADDAWYLPPDTAAGAAIAHEAGAYYLQEPSAMTAAAALGARPGERVLDLCAAPGGKSTQLAAAMRGEGLLVCNEPYPDRARVLSRNIERMGVENAVVVSAMPEALKTRWRGFFDRVLVDAPCSGEGMFRRHPETRAAWSPAAPEGCAARQRAILSSAAEMLKPGGFLAYSTCTFNSAENEGVIEAFLRERRDFALVPFTLPGLPPTDGVLRFFPHRARGEGHFAALMRKSEDADARAAAPAPLPAPNQNDAAVARAFLSEFLEAPPPIAVFGGTVVSAPAPPPLDGVRALRVGLHLGQVRGRLFLPDHALALARACRVRVALTENEARAYLRGETLPCGERGWLALTYEGMQLGLGKASDGQIKNHYPKGLRK